MVQLLNVQLVIRLMLLKVNGLENYVTYKRIKQRLNEISKF
jgi:hypothetical protein